MYRYYIGLEIHLFIDIVDMNISSLKHESFISFYESPEFAACSKTWSDLSLVCEILEDHYADYKLTSGWTDCSDWHKLPLGNSKCVREAWPLTARGIYLRWKKRRDLALTAQMSILWTWATQGFQRHPHILWDRGGMGRKEAQTKWQVCVTLRRWHLTPSCLALFFPLKALI